MSSASGSKRTWRKENAPANTASATRFQRWFYSLLGLGLVALFVWYLVLPLFAAKTHLLMTSGQYDLLSSGVIEFPKEDMQQLEAVTLRGSVEAPTVLQSSGDLRALGEKMAQVVQRPKDTVIVYASALGISDAGVPYLVSGDFPFNNRIELEALIAQLQKSKAQHKLLILDAVHTEHDPRLGMIINEFPTLLEKAVHDSSDENLWVMSSCGLLQSSQVSYKSKESIFAHFVARALAGEADADDDGSVSLAEFNTFVTSGVSRSTGGKQTPQLLQGGQGFQTAPPALALLTVVEQENVETPEGESTTALKQIDLRGLAMISPMMSAAALGQAETNGDAPAGAATTEGSAKPAGEATTGNATTAPPAEAAPKPEEVKPEPSVPRAVESPRELIQAAWELRDRWEDRGTGQSHYPVDFAPHLWREFNARLLAYETKYRTGQSFDQNQLLVDLQRIEDTLRKPDYRSGDETRSLPYRLYEALAKARGASGAQVFEPEQNRNDAEYRAVDFVAWHAAESFASPVAVPVGRDIASLLSSIANLKFPTASESAEVESIERQSRNMRELTLDIQRAIEKQAEGLLDPVRPQESQNIERMLSTPTLRADLRMRLVDKLAGAERLSPEIRDVDMSAAPASNAVQSWRWERLHERAALQLDVLALAAPQLVADLRPMLSNAGDDQAKLMLYRSIGDRIGRFYRELPRTIEIAATTGDGNYTAADIPRLLRLVDARDVRDVTDRVYDYLRPLPPLRKPVAILALQEPSADTRDLRLNFENWTDLDVRVYAKGERSTGAALEIEFDPKQIEMRSKEGAPITASTPVQIFPPQEGEQQLTYQVRVKPGQTLLKPISITLTGGQTPQTRRLNLVLPAPDRVDLQVRRLSAELADRDEWTKTRGDVTQVRPFPNRATNYTFSLVNQSQRDKKVRVDLYAVPTPRNGQAPTAEQIDLWVRDQEGTRIGGTEKELTLSVGSGAVPVPFAAFPPAPMPGAPPAAPDAPPPVVAVPASMACVISDVENTERRWVHLINVAPLSPWRYLEPEVRYDSNAGQIVVDLMPVDYDNDGRTDLELTPLANPEATVKVTWDITQTLPPDTAANTTAELKRDSARKTLFASVPPSRDKRVLVELNVDGYPRALIYDVSLDPEAVGSVKRETEFRRVQVRLSEDSRLINIPADMKETPMVKFGLLIDAPEDLFQSTGHAVEYGIDANRDRQISDEEKRTLLSDRLVTNQVTSLAANGEVTIRSQVSDFDLTLAVGGFRNQRVDVRAQLVLDGEVSTADAAEVVLDATDPELRVDPLKSTTVFKGDPVALRAKASDLSGVDFLGFKVVRNRNDSIEDEDKLEPLDFIEGETWRGTLDTGMLQPGQYAVLLRATDKVKRHSETRTLTLEVREKPKPPMPDMAKKEAEKPTKGTLQGVVRFDDSGYPGAKVKLSGPASGETKSGGGGVFKFDDLPAGQYTIEVEGTPRNKTRKAKATVDFTPPKLATPVKIELQ